MTCTVHADAPRVVDGEFAGHRLADHQARSWIVRDPATDRNTFVVTWVPDHALVVSGLRGNHVYSGFPQLESLGETIDVITSADFDWLCRRSSHEREFDGDMTVFHIVREAYRQLRDTRSHFRRGDLMARIMGWAELDMVDDGGRQDRKNACLALINTCIDEDEIKRDFPGAVITYKWSIAAMWIHEALFAWAHQMAQRRSEEQRLAGGEGV